MGCVQSTPTAPTGQPLQPLELAEPSTCSRANKPIKEARRKATPLPEELERVLELSPYPMCASDVLALDQPVVYVNDRFLDMLKYKRSDVMNVNCRFLQGPGTDLSTVKQIKESILQGKRFMGRLLNFTKDGEPMWNYLLLQPLRNAEGVVTHFTALQMLAARGDFNGQLQSASEMSLIAEHIDRQNLDICMSASRALPSSPEAPLPETTEQVDDSSVLNLEVRNQLTKIFSESYKTRHISLVLLDSLCPRRDALPIVFVSQPFLGDTFLSEHELLGCPLASIISAPDTELDKPAEMLGQMEEALCSVEAQINFRQDCTLRTKHKAMPSPLGLLVFAPVEINGTTPYYLAIFHKHQTDNKVAENGRVVDKITRKSLKAIIPCLETFHHSCAGSQRIGDLEWCAPLKLQSVPEDESLRNGKNVGTPAESHIRLRSLSVGKMTATLEDAQEVPSEGTPITESANTRTRQRTELVSLLPEKQQWIDLVMHTMSQPGSPHWGLTKDALKALKQ
mmetsp:Transcript_41275/g.69074  ORF Transcript_41275/g.69074 Transcript_41275/m.69074 type:complete len:509 (-) Transcript_41275:26-1552(-)|eukprot:CAMPEP_0198229328 /NCGR_PEP_ID=MMETSP1445-20131203/114067_1 /TAXON_ID=36898 /ORGANISM="Pyramimonas sp., Strain CCMP2087" /LENGTH=508 /DNA_ID=CAMNT_0043909785 /DNA_START=240 /DNA_END=1766 /DNA_ORIENTATION=-